MVKLDKSVQVTLIIAAVVLILVITGIVYFRSTSGENTIQINGQSTVKAVPDLITVYFSVSTEGTTSKAAEDSNSVIVNALKNGMVSLGFAETDLKTQSYNIYPNYDYNGVQKIVGYTATHSLKIQISTASKDKLSGIIDAGTNAGAGISYINFELSPTLEQEYKTQAITEASNDAKVKAQAVASGFDKSLGRLVSVSLDQFSYYPWNIYASKDSAVGGGVSNEEAKRAVSSITPSEQDVSASVTAVYKLR